MRGNRLGAYGVMHGSHCYSRPFYVSDDDQCAGDAYYEALCKWVSTAHL